MSNDLNFASVWLKQAERDLISARNSYKSKDYYVAALLCQQSVEKALKYLYINKNNKLIRTHDLVKLAREIKAPLNIIKCCSLINPIYIEVRYPADTDLPADKVNSTIALQLLNKSDEVLKWVQKQN